MAFAFGQRSLSRLEGVHPDLVAVAKRAIEISDIDFMVVEGVRSDEQCRINYGKGRTAAQCRAAGIDAKYARPELSKVTWLKNPYNSRHRKQADGFGQAVDLLPAPYDWKDPKGFDRVAKAMNAAANELGVNITWGADWDDDGVPRERGETDSPHFELTR
jgi:peptidoglycan L-alanyl-D-glutamate endopeptidase CwlK